MKKEAQVILKPISAGNATLTIEGTSPLIMHKWSEKALRQIREKKGGRKTKDRDICIPEQECLDATYVTVDGRVGIPAMALKSAILSAAHKDLGVEKTLVRKSLFIVCNDANSVLPITGSDPKMREDYVRVGMGGTDLRYRPQVDQWEVTFDIQFDEDMLSLQDIANLIDRAGFGVGICEWRPEKGGEFGRFKVKTS